MTENIPPVRPGTAQPHAPQSPGSSGYRVASSIVAIVLGAWLFLQFLAGTSVPGFAPFLFLIAAAGTLASAITLLVKQHGRRPEAPALLLGWTLFAFLACFIVALGFGVYPGTFVAPLLAVSVLIVTGIGLSREKRGL